MKTAVVVGLGVAGRRHAEWLRRLVPELRIVGLRHRPSQEPVPVDDVVFSVDDALAYNPDIAVIAGPATSRIAVAAHFAEHGVHLFLEKPVSIDLAGLGALRSVARRERLTVAVGYNLRFYPPLQIARRSLMAAELGSVWAARAEVGQYLPDWRPGSDYRSSVSSRRSLGGGAVLELSHELDYMGWLLGPPSAVTAMAAKVSDLDLDVEDVVEASIRFGATLANVHLDFLQREPVRQAAFIGEAGSLRVDLLRGVVTLDHVEHGRRDVSPPRSDLQDTYRAQLVDFLAAVRDQTPPTVPLDDGIAALRLALAIKRSSAERTAIALRPELDDSGFGSEGR